MFSFKKIIHIKYLCNKLKTCETVSGRGGEGAAANDPIPTRAGLRASLQMLKTEK